MLTYLLFPLFFCFIGIKRWRKLAESRYVVLPRPLEVVVVVEIIVIVVVVIVVVYSGNIVLGLISQNFLPSLLSSGYREC